MEQTPQVLIFTHIHKGIPPLPEITVGDNTDGLTKLRLDSRRHGKHQGNELTLDGGNLGLWQLVVSIFIDPLALDEVLEAKGAGKTNIVGMGSGGRDLEEL
jgi:hypothetical protein